MSGNYGEPDWITPGASTDVATTKEEFSPTDTVGIGVAQNGTKDRSTLTQRLLSIVNVLLAISMCTLGVLGLMNKKIRSMDHFSEIFICVYMVLFSAILFFYEFMWWMTIPKINLYLRKNFGFMFGMKGKGLFLIFVAFLAMGIENGQEEWLRYITGIAYLVVGIFHNFLVCFKPELVDNYKSPSAGLQNSEGDSNPV